MMKGPLLSSRPEWLEREDSNGPVRCQGLCRPGEKCIFHQATRVAFAFTQDPEPSPPGLRLERELEPCSDLS